MTSVKILNFYNLYMNKIITSYYTIAGMGKGKDDDDDDEDNDEMDMMELGYGSGSWSFDDDYLLERDIENNLPFIRLSLIHPDQCV